MPTPAPQPVPAAPEVVYLVDLPETEVRLGSGWTLGKRGDMGFYFQKVDPKQTGAAHSIAVAAPCHVSYLYLEGPAFYRANAHHHCLDSFPRTGQTVVPDPQF